MDDSTRNIMEAYGLADICRGHSLHGDYPLFQFSGLLDVSAVAQSSEIRRAEEITGLLACLWNGVRVRVSTPLPGTYVFDTDDAALNELLLTHISGAAQAIQQDNAWMYGEPEAEVEAPVDPEQYVTSLKPVPGGLMSLPREIRLARARALEGHMVYDTSLVEQTEARLRLQEYALLAFRVVEDEEDEPELSDDEIRAIMDYEQIQYAESPASDPPEGLFW